MEDATVLASADLDFAVGNGICVDGVYYVPISEVDEDSITTEEEETETETIELDESEEVVSISLIFSFTTLGIAKLNSEFTFGKPWMLCMVASLLRIAIIAKKPKTAPEPVNPWTAHAAILFLLILSRLKNTYFYIILYNKCL